MPPDILPEFQQTALRYNRISMLVICIMIFGMKLFNMAGILFDLRKAGALNNCIYFIGIAWAFRDCRPVSDP